MSLVDAAVLRARAGYRLRLAELAEWLAIPSVPGPDLARAARWLVEALRRAGARTSVVGSGVVVARFLGPAGSPVVVVYGHYDVVPPGPGWTSPPFRPVIRDGVLYARGANDDKGQLYACVAALQAWHDVGVLPATVVVIAEGAEEIGSPGLPAALASIASRVRPDVVLACDTERSGDGTPSVTVSQRGLILLDVSVDVGGPPVHAGRLGGAVVDPSDVLSGLLSSWREMLARAPVVAEGRVVPRSDRAITRAAGGRAVVGSGLDRRVTSGPALTVVRMRAGDGPGAVPVRASARVDVRLPAPWDVNVVLADLRGGVRAPRGVRIDVKVLGAQPGYAATPRQDVLAAVDAASAATFGRPAALVRSGGSLPAARMLATAFGRTPVLLGLGTPSGGAHGPDERLDIAGWERCVELLVRLLARPVLRPHAVLPRRAIQPVTIL